MDILERIEQIRLNKNMSIYKLADKCGIARNTIYNWYSKHYTPSLETIKIICEKGFDMTLGEFFTLDSDILPIKDKDTKEVFERYSLLTDAQKEAVKQIIFSYSKR